MKLTDKQILITGADGFIGSHLTETLLDMGCRVRALSLYNSLRSLFCGVSRLKPVAEWTDISIWKERIAYNADFDVKNEDIGIKNTYKWDTLSEITDC